MLTRGELENKFTIYFEEVSRCLKHRCGWSLLHLMLALPDVCGALESDDGVATGPRYKDWCRRYLTDPLLLPAERWDLRCVLLHQGRTLSGGGPAIRYQRYTFAQPEEEGPTGHRVEGGTTLHLDVRTMAFEVTRVMRQWFDELECGTDPVRSRNVERNLPSLAVVSPIFLKGPKGPLGPMEVSASPGR